MPRFRTTQVVYPMLAEIGFRKRADEIFTMDLAEDIIGWLGLNRATEHYARGVASIYPIMGIRHQAVERIVSEVWGEKLHSYVPATVSMPLSALFNDRKYHCWIFAPETAKETAELMVEAIVQHGLPYLRSNATLPDIIRLIEQGAGHDHLLRERHPVALQLAGRPDEAMAVLERELARIADHTYPAADYFRRFAAAYRERFGTRD